ncbi:hypothetical protein BOVMAS04_03170 [Streptococcus uberis]
MTSAGLQTIIKSYLKQGMPLKEDTLRAFYQLYPEKFNNKTNGIVQRRWTQIAAPELSIEAQNKIDLLYRDQKKWSQMSLVNIAHSDRFTSDDTIEEYTNEIWHLNKINH